MHTDWWGRLMRRLGVLALTVGVIGVGVGTVHVAAQWRAAEAPLDVSPVSMETITAESEAEASRAAVLAGQVADVATMLDGLRSGPLHRQHQYHRRYGARERAPESARANVGEAEGPPVPAEGRPGPTGPAQRRGCPAGGPQRGCALVVGLTAAKQPTGGGGAEPGDDGGEGATGDN